MEPSQQDSCGEQQQLCGGMDSGIGDWWWRTAAVPPEKRQAESPTAQASACFVPSGSSSYRHRSYLPTLVKQ